MKLYDASIPVRKGMVTFPGDPPFRKEPCFQIEKRDPVNLAVISMGTHQGTHVDSPAHYFDGGATVGEISLDTLAGPGIVLDMRGISQIDRQALESAPIGDHVRVLLKTDNGPLLLESSFHKDYVHLTEDGAKYLVEKGVGLVGIDYISIERYENPGAPVHRTLLQAGVLIVEGVHLLEVPPGPYEIFCLPICIKGADGAPARVLLREQRKPLGCINKMAKQV